MISHKIIYQLANLALPFFSLKGELQKLENEKQDIQRHYVMYYEMCYGLNVEMHKQVSFSFIFIRRDLCVQKNPLINSPLEFNLNFSESMILSFSNMYQIISDSRVVFVW